MFSLDFFLCRNIYGSLFLRENRWKKRGIAVVPTKFGIAFSVLFLNQAGALVNVYTDGSVLLSHGGVEMGQGLHTKMIQVASRALGIPVDKIHISETATDKVPNASATAASAGSDLNGMAVKVCHLIFVTAKKLFKLFFKLNIQIVLPLVSGNGCYLNYWWSFGILHYKYRFISCIAFFVVELL